MGPRRTCPVTNCTFYNQDKTSNFSFPRAPEICLKWVEFTKNHKIMALLEEKGCAYLNKNYKICSWHFRKNQLKNPDCTSKGLKPGEVPMLSHPDEIYSEHFRKQDENCNPDNSEINCAEDSKVGLSDGIIIEYPENTIEYQENHNSFSVKEDVNQLLEPQNNLVYDDIFQDNFLVYNPVQGLTQSGIENPNLSVGNVKCIQPKVLITPINGFLKNKIMRTEVMINGVSYRLSLPESKDEKRPNMTTNGYIRPIPNGISVPKLQNSASSSTKVTCMNGEDVYNKSDNGESIQKKDEHPDDLQYKEESSISSQPNERLQETENGIVSSISDLSNENLYSDNESINNKTDECLYADDRKTDRSIENFLIINALTKNPNDDYNTIKKQVKVIGADKSVKYPDTKAGNRHLSKMRKLKVENEYLKKKVAFLQKKIKSQAWELKILRSEIMFGAGVSKSNRFSYHV